MMTAADFIRWYIQHWEGQLSLDPKDRGNWWKGQLVGSKYGITAAALSLERQNTNITAADMSNLTEDEAVSIGLSQYYHDSGMDKLPWNHVTASVLDKAWGSGPKTAIRLLQGLIGVSPDGIIGDDTVKAYQNWIQKTGEAQAAIIWAKTRENFDLSLHQPRFLKGWNNRTTSYLPDSQWWSAMT
ncbi:putative peptidoglycan binding protein [Zymomonas mobilis]|uniref:Putative peptidoglycan binding protein n=1 Tax=Zymomonas mobilis TaxID=542 RepID=A0A542W199_ZYMMB|nr:glycosyl hydrolase 108 family protein [Zymomonas mobilis]TQL17347.1 putative peptidoglycan binding protein [Zymomonas mobilis]